jgi:hypothetical protein
MFPESRGVLPESRILSASSSKPMIVLPGESTDEEGGDIYGDENVSPLVAANEKRTPVGTPKAAAYEKRTLVVTPMRQASVFADGDEEDDVASVSTTAKKSFRRLRRVVTLDDTP